MRLVSASRTRPQLLGSPLASLALLVLTSVVIVGLFAAARGPGMRFATAAEAEPFPETGVITVTVVAGGGTEVDGVPVATESLAATLEGRLSGRGDGRAVLIVSPEATYGEMVTAYAALASVRGLQVAIPTRGWAPARGTL